MAVSISDPFYLFDLSYEPRAVRPEARILFRKDRTDPLLLVQFLPDEFDELFAVLVARVQLE
jgi:hypothetical protein